MGLKAILASLDGINDEAIKKLYVERDGKFYLDVTGVEFEEDVKGLKSALEKERETRRQLSEDLNKFKDLDPEKARAALEKLHELEEQDLLDAGKIDELLARRTEQMRLDMEGKMQAQQDVINTLTGDRDNYQRKLSDVLIDGAITNVAAQAKVRNTAIEDVVNRGRSVFKLIDGVPTPVDSNGKTIYGKDAKEPMTMDEWMGTLNQSAPHLFEASSGSGATGSGGGSGGPGYLSTDDQDTLNANLYDIASGKKVVSE